MNKMTVGLLGCLAYAITTSVSYAECSSGSQSWDTPGEYKFTVPSDCNSINVKAWGAGGGGMGAEPWGTGTGGNGGFVEAQVPGVSGTEYRVIVAGGGKGTSCGGGTNGGGGGGHSSLLDMDYNPLISAGGGGGAEFYTAPCHGGASCPLTAHDGGGDGWGYGGGGEQSDSTATNGQPGSGPPDFIGGLQGSGNCGTNLGSGGFGGGGGGGGTHNGLGGGGGGGGYPGGPGGGSRNAGHGGSNYVHSSATQLVNDSNGSSGGIGAQDGENGKVIISWAGLPTLNVQSTLGGQIKLIAKPESGYKFLGFECPEGSPPAGKKETWVTGNGSMDCVAIFYPDGAETTLTVEVNGSGTVADKKFGEIDCPSDCEGTYEIGSKVTLIAKPAKKFTQWTGDCEPAKKPNQAKVLMNEEKSCTAHFE